MSPEKYWNLPAITRDAIGDAVLFHGGCHVWYETAPEYKGNGFHVAEFGCTMRPVYAPDYQDVGVVTRDTLPDMCSYRFALETLERIERVYAA